MAKFTCIALYTWTDYYKDNILNVGETWLDIVTSLHDMELFEWSI